MRASTRLVIGGIGRNATAMSRCDHFSRSRRLGHNGNHMYGTDSTDGATRHPRRRGSTEAYVERGEYFVQHADVFRPIGDYREWTDDKLLYPAPDDQEAGGIFVRTGTFYGPVAITVETYDSADEAVPDGGDWEIVQEVSLVAKGPNLRVETDSGVEIDLPQLHLAPGETAGARIHARGVEKAAEVQEIRLRDGAIEHHLLQLWRA